MLQRMFFFECMVLSLCLVKKYSVSLSVEVLFFLLCSVFANLCRYVVI